MKEQKQTFADLAARFIGKPYSEQGTGPDSYGCLGFCYAFLKAAGKRVDDAEWTYGGYTVNNFMEAWKEDPVRMESLLLEGVEQVGQPVPVQKRVAGDLLIMRSRTGGHFPGTHCDVLLRAL